MNADWHEKFKMLSDKITDEQKANRKILRDAMEKEDFVWYPGEWWHYCFGDRMWAVYSNQRECFYGPIEL
jgi:D-alanyl-D-alanine dipeptidase